MIAYPRSVLIGSKWIPFEKLSKEQLTGFAQMCALDALMRGTPFADVISDAMQYAHWWSEKQ